MRGLKFFRLVYSHNFGIHWRLEHWCWILPPLGLKFWRAQEINPNKARKQKNLLIHYSHRSGHSDGKLEPPLPYRIVRNVSLRPASTFYKRVGANSALASLFNCKVPSGKRTDFYMFQKPRSQLPNFRARKPNHGIYSQFL